MSPSRVGRPFGRPMERDGRRQRRQRPRLQGRRSSDASDARLRRASAGQAAQGGRLPRQLAALSVARRGGEPAEFALDEPGEGERRPVFVFGADNLHADRQAVRDRDRNDGGRQAAGRRGIGPDQLLKVGKLLPVDRDLPVGLRLRMIVGKGGRRGRRAEDDVKVLEQGAIAVSAPGARNRPGANPCGS